MKWKRREIVVDKWEWQLNAEPNWKNETILTNQITLKHVVRWIVSQKSNGLDHIHVNDATYENTKFLTPGLLDQSDMVHNLPAEIDDHN